MSRIRLEAHPAHAHADLTIDDCHHQLDILDLHTLEELARHAASMARLHQTVRGIHPTDATLEE